MTSQSLPDWAILNGYWEATDGNGDVFAYSNKPLFHEKVEVWDPKNGDHAELKKSSSTKGFSNPRDSLRWIPPEHEQGAEQPRGFLPPVGSRVNVEGIGKGTVKSHSGQTVVIDFDEHGLGFFGWPAIEIIKSDRDKAVEWAKGATGWGWEYTPTLRKLYDLGALRIPEDETEENDR